MMCSLNISSSSRIASRSSLSFIRARINLCQLDRTQEEKKQVDAHACRSSRDAVIVIRLACANVRSMSPRCSLLVTNNRKFGPNSAIRIHAWSSAARFFCGMFSASSRASITTKTRSRGFDIASMHFKMSSITGGDRRLAGVKILGIAWGWPTWEANCFTRLPKMLCDVWFV